MDRVVHYREAESYGLTHCDVPITPLTRETLSRQRTAEGVMSDKIIEFTHYSNNSKSWTPKQMLEEAIKRVSPGGDREDVKKAIVIYLDDNKVYRTDYNQAGMKVSEVVALLQTVLSEYVDILKGE